MQQMLSSMLQELAILSGTLIMQAMMSTAFITCGTGGAAEVIAATNQVPITSHTKTPIAIANHHHWVSNMEVLPMVKCQEMCTV